MLQVRPSAKDPAYAILVIPERLMEFKVDISGIPGLFKPDVVGFPPAQIISRGGLFSGTQEMANYISLELDRCRNKVPAYTPFIVQKVSASPWAVTSKDHMADVARWRTSARKAKREDNPQPIPMQAWLLYQMRFLIAADLAGAWLGFGAPPPN